MNFDKEMELQFKEILVNVIQNDDFWDEIVDETFSQFNQQLGEKVDDKSFWSDVEDFTEKLRENICDNLLPSEIKL